VHASLLVACFLLVGTRRLFRVSLPGGSYSSGRLLTFLICGPTVQTAYYRGTVSYTSDTAGKRRSKDTTRLFYYFFPPPLFQGSYRKRKGHGKESGVGSLERLYDAASCIMPFYIYAQKPNFPVDSCIFQLFQLTGIQESCGFITQWFTYIVHFM